MVEVWQTMAEGGEATEHSEKEGRKEGWQVILRNRSESQVVLYHPENKQLAVNGSAGRGNVEGPMGRRVHGHGSSGMVGSACPYCGAQNGESWIWEDGVPAREPDERPAGSPYMASNYFRLLEMSSFKDHQSRGGRGDDSDSLGKGALNEGYYRRFFVEERRLGTGSKGSVFLCQHVMDDVPLGRYAVKKIPVGNNHQWLVNVLREVKILEGLHHPNIIEYKHTWLEEAQLSDFGAEVPCLFVLTEYANDGNLAQYMLEDRGDAAEGASGSENADDADDLHARRLQRERKRRRLLRKLRRASAAEVGSQAETNVAEESLRVLPEHLIWKFFAEIVAGLEHLHRHGIVHRDIKPQNLLLHVDKGDHVPRVLISDFGECQILAEAELRARTGATGTVEFTAPELLRVSPDGGYSFKYDERCDIWSLGVVLYQMAYSKLPWRSSGADADALIEEIAAYQHLRPENTIVRSLEMRMLINSMLVQDPDERPTAGALLDAVTSLLSASDEAMSSPRIPSPVISGHGEARNAHDSADARNNMSGGWRAGEPVTPLMLECGPPEENETPLDKDPVLKTVRSLRDDSLGPVRLQRGLRVARLVLGTLKVLACSKLSCGPFLADLLVLSAFVFELLRASFRWTPREHTILATAQAAVLMAIVGLIGNRSCLGSERSDVLSAAAIAVLCAASVFTEVGAYLRAGLDTDKYAPGFLNGFLKTFNPSRAQKP